MIAEVLGPRERAGAPRSPAFGPCPAPTVMPMMVAKGLPTGGRRHPGGLRRPATIHRRYATGWGDGGRRRPGARAARLPSFVAARRVRVMVVAAAYHLLARTAHHTSSRAQRSDPEQSIGIGILATRDTMTVIVRDRFAALAMTWRRCGGAEEVGCARDDVEEMRRCRGGGMRSQ